tara:strand:- start:4053 stop:4754 length:702 start_codon:yes stop_codon:yes gene_type:complete
MGYLNNSSITIDAILTRKGRELLARGRNEFDITHFALADDEIDYTLWNSDHPLGTAYYGVVIENMPITEAIPDETQMLKYKLVTLPKRTIRIPVISVPQKSVTLMPGQSLTINPQTVNYTAGNSTFGYTFTLADSDVCTMYVDETAKSQKFISDITSKAAPMSESEIGQSLTLTGKSVVLTANLLQLASKRTTLIITGVETGGRVIVDITVQKVTTNTTPNIPLTGQPPISLP